MIVVLLDISLLRMKLGQLQSNFLPILAAFGFACELLLSSLDSPIGSLELVLGMLKCDSIAQNEQVFQTKVNSNSFACEFFRSKHLFDQKADPVGSIWIHGNCSIPEFT